MVLESAGVSAPRAVASVVTVVAVAVGVLSVLALFGAMEAATADGGDVLGPLAAGVGGLVAALLLHTVAVVLRWLAAFWVRTDRR